MCLRVSNKKNIWKKIFLASFKSLKKGVGSWVGSISQRYDPWVRVRTKISRIANTDFKSYSKYGINGLSLKRNITRRGILKNTR